MSSNPRARITRFELALVVVVSLVVLVPGISRYTLLDPWETHYGEVSRMMLQNHDWVHTEWPGSYGGGFDENEGFRSKPVLQFWMMSAGMKAFGVGADGGYSGEMTDSARVLIAIRLPFILSAIAGLTLMWLMLSRLVNRRVAWLGLLVVGSTPMFCMIARTAIPDMPMAASTIGAMALFTLAMEDGDRGFRARRLGRFDVDARHLVLGLVAAFTLVQVVYYAHHFFVSPQLAVRGMKLNPAVWLPLSMLGMLALLARDGWLILRMPLWLIGGVIAALVGEPLGTRRDGQSLWRHVIDDTVTPWDRHAPDRYLRRGLVVPFTAIAGKRREGAWDGAEAWRRSEPIARDLWRYPLRAVLWLGTAAWGAATGTFGARGAWDRTDGMLTRLVRLEPITSMRQVYLVGAYALIGLSVLAKGPPGLAVFGGVVALHCVLLGRWRALWNGDYEVKRALIVIVLVFLPWHVAMWLKDGLQFINEYLFTHVLNRAGSGVDNSPGTFEYYTDQIGHGMWLWAGLLPAAVAGVFLRARTDTREGRVRFMIGLWAVVAVAVFCLVKTKFHHYILPALPPLGLLVAFLLDDVYTRRERLHPLFAALGVAIVLMLCRDLMFEPDRWIEMFVFLYNRPWPDAEPYAVDPSDGFLLLGIAAAIAIVLLSTRWRRLAVATTCGVGLAICIYALQVYMPLAAPHWGMGDAVRSYYQQRSIYGVTLVYFGTGELRDDWNGRGDTWTFDTKLPDAFQVGQPMTIDVRLHKPDDIKTRVQQLVLVGTATGYGEHSITITLAPGERHKLDALIADAAPAKVQGELASAQQRLTELQRQAKADKKPNKTRDQQLAALRGQVAVLADGKRGRRAPFRAVDADRLIAWQLYWRGENFWSGEEILGFIPEMKTAFPNTNNVEINKYMPDRTRMPFNRRYFVVANAGQLPNIKSLIPSERGKQTFEILDQTSNKFWLGAFTP
jgi:4-amino-4-deoxy-L-arabinose transferase-like glycosyltransferase